MSAACRRWYPKWLEIVAPAARTGLRQAIQSWWAPCSIHDCRLVQPLMSGRFD